MGTNVNKDLTKKLVALSIEVSIFGGRKKLNPIDFEDSNVTSQDLNVISLGSKKTIDPQLIAPFYKIKRQAAELARAYSVFFNRFYLVSHEKFNEVEEQLSTLEKMFYDYKLWFVSNYKQNVSDWANKNDAWREKILNSAPALEYVEDSLDFTFLSYKIEASSFKLNSRDRNGNFVKKEDMPLGELLLVEISEDANKYFKHFIEGGKLSSKTISPLVKIKEKLESLSFIDSKITPLIKSVNDMINSLKSAKNYGPEETISMLALVNVFTDPQKMLLLGNSQYTVDELFEDTMETSKEELLQNVKNPIKIDSDFF